MKLYIALAFLPLLLFSCKEDEIKPYHGDQYLYFSQLMNEKDQTVDSLLVSFNNYPTQDELIVKIGLGLVGSPFSEPTPYKILIVDSLTTAQAKNYQLPDPPLFKAGVATDSLEVKLIKTDDLSENVKLCLQIVPNEYFAGSMKQYERIRIVFNNVISKPLWWTNTVTKIYLGAYSRAKYEALVIYTGITDFGKLNSGEKRQCALKLKDAIEKYDLKEENGKPMTVPIY